MAAKGQTPIRLNKNVRAAKSHEIPTISDFVAGYRNREDTSLLKPQTLVAGSHDVLTNVSGRLGSRKGYTIDGPASSVQAPIRSPFDWETQTGAMRHLRAGFLTGAGNDGKLQVRYVDSAGVVSYLDLLTGLTSTTFNYVNFWESANVRALLLMVNGSQGMWEWTGALGTVSLGVSNQVTLNGTKTLAQLGFSPTGSFIANSVTYAYTGITGQNFTGVTPDASSIAVNTPLYQAPVFTPVGSMTFTVTPTPPADFTFDLISQLNNQVFFGSLNYNLIWMSKAGTYKDYSQSTARVQYEGDQFTTQGSLKAFIPEDEKLWISAGIEEWYYTEFDQTTITNQNTGVTTTFENAQLKRIKTTSAQGSQSQALTTKIKNNILYVSFEPIVNSLGTVADYLNSPQVVDMSFPIVNDMNNYNFTGGSVFYDRQFAYLAVPKNGLFRMYNMTNPKNPFWEAPINIPLTSFSRLETGQILGHSYLTSESYVLFNGYSDRAVDTNSVGNPISAEAVFAFQTEGVRPQRKSFNKFFIEGYMSTNTNISVGLTFRSPNAGLSPAQSFIIQGNQPYVLGQGQDNSLGKYSFGKQPLGGDAVTTQQNSLPYYFAVIKTTQRLPFLNFQPSFASYGVNQPWELLSFGTNMTPATEGENDITI